MPPHTQHTSTGAPRPLQMRISAMADRGMAMGQVDGQVVFVPFAAPGDLVEVEVVRRKRRYLQTRLLRVLEPAPHRREPPCPHFMICGGCQWQHLPYGDQLAGKAQSFRGFVSGRLGLVDTHAFREPIESPREWGYRNRVGLKVRSPGGRAALGFFATGTQRLVPVQHCAVAHPRINLLLPPLSEFLLEWPPARDSLPQIDLQVDAEEGLWCILHLLRPLTQEERQGAVRFLRDSGVEAAWIQSGRKHTLAELWPDGPPKMSFRVRVRGAVLPLSVSPGGFVQANAAVNQALVDEVVSLSPIYAGRTVLDLYSGAGNFTLPLAQAAGEVLAIEGYPPAARDAAENAVRSGFDHVQVVDRSVAAALGGLAAAGHRPEFALLDPPREGAAEVVGPLAALGPETILYISCSPPTLVRDVKLLGAHGYRVKWTRMADMFPQTAHMESLTLLERVCF